MLTNSKKEKKKKLYVESKQIQGKFILEHPLFPPIKNKKLRRILLLTFFFLSF